MSTNSISTAPTSENVIRRDNKIIYTNAAGEYHRLDGPAIEYDNGDKEWWQNGQRHRLDGPAIERSEGHKSWWIRGMLHRLDGPAVDHADGHKEWWIRGTLHREDGPAVEYTTGRKVWYQNGRLHRLDGPAIEDPFYDILSWYIDGKYYKTEKEWEKARCPSIEEAAAMFKEAQSCVKK